MSPSLGVVGIVGGGFVGVLVVRFVGSQLANTSTTKQKVRIRNPNVLFPLNGRWGFSADVIHNAINATYIIDDLSTDVSEKVVR